MKTSFKIAWVDDNFNDPQMRIASQLSKKLERKNGFTLETEDVYGEVTKGDFDGLLSNLAATIDLSNSVDLVVIDYQLGGDSSGEKIASKFRAKLPSLDILFYSGKENAENLRQLIAGENVDGINCVGRNNLAEGTYTVIENIINRSYKISTLRGLILNSVCEMDHMIREILYKYSAADKTQMGEVKNEAIKTISYNTTQQQKILMGAKSIEDLLNDKRMMSGKLFSIFEKIKGKLKLSQQQLILLRSYRKDILDLRSTAAHAKEATCMTTGQSMLQFKNLEYKRGNIDEICRKIVKHEKNIHSIQASMP
jgi:hypothetical protein